jgi:hypothetical protein
MMAGTASDQAPMSCELRFHGESFGWEAQFLERGELFASRGAFVGDLAFGNDNCQSHTSSGQRRLSGRRRGPSQSR